MLMKKLLILFCFISLNLLAQEEPKKGEFYLGAGFQKIGTFYFNEPNKYIFKYTALQINMNYTKNNWNVGTNFGLHSFGLYVSRKLF